MAEQSMLTPEMRMGLEEFYFRYAECLDGGRVQHWPEFFLDSCSYRITTRRNLRLGEEEDLMSLRTKTSMRDRIAAIGQSEDYEPYTQRHFITNFRLQLTAENDLRVTANIHILRTFPDRATEFLASGYYLDRVAMTGTRFAFKEKLCVFDSDVPPESLVYPV